MEGQGVIQLKILQQFPKIQYNLPSMKRVHAPTEAQKKGVQLFSDMMLMKFKPKNTEGDRLAKELLVPGHSQQELDNAARNQKPNNQIRYVQVASKDAVIIGDYNQLDMINIDGLSHNFVDTFYYWSLNISKPILNVKLSIKKELMLVQTIRSMLLYSYTTIKKDKSQPTLISVVELPDGVRFIQIPTSDLIAVFYDDYFAIYSLTDANIATKKLQKKYNVSPRLKLFAVPQAIDHTVNIFFEEPHEKRKTFGLWCIEVKLQTENIKINPPYKIYDIMNGLKKILILENYSKDIVFLNLGQEILVAKKGYIVDSVNINLQIQSSYLRYLPRKQILVHIQKNSMDLYSFKINVNSIPHRIQLTSLDSIQIKPRKDKARLISLLPVFDNNYALFYEDTTRKTTRGEIFYSFVLSYTVQINQKVNQILETGKILSQISEEELQAKCEVLRKIGLTDQQIYLEIWRRSTRSTLKDFQYILATRDYKTIKTEIQSKLKKQSMSFKEVLKIQESCLHILRPKIDSEHCNEELLKDYLTCSLFLRKLILFRQLHLLTNNITEEDRVFYINIQDYYTLKNMELKQFVLEKVFAYLFGGKDNIDQIRLVLNHFRFVYRHFYRDLLEKIIKISKNQLRRILEAIPQLLPIDTELVANGSKRQEFYRGVWYPISEEEWEFSLYLEKVMTVSNRKVVEEFIEGLWYKRNMLTTHDFIAKSSAAIQKANETNNSVQIFYFFIDKTFESIKDQAILKKVLSYLEHTYDKMPKHLENKILLYSRLYRYYRNNFEAARCPEFSFAQFLQLRDYNLFKYFFDLQKMKKNALLKQIKPIYEQVLRQQGSTIFNLSLFNYFKSQISEVSNLKYLLNRINNQKKEFHQVNEKMYEILIRAMQFKLRIGSSNDIPVDQVLIYVENIPISKDNKAMIRQLEIIQKISEESDIFKKMRINMTIREIIDNYEVVIEKLVEYLIKKNGILALDNVSTVLNKTYRILAEVQSIKEKIYGTDYNQLAFFIYLTKLLQHPHKVPIANAILTDEYLNNYYFIDLKIIESLVLYMYRWKFSQNSSFPANRNYILQLTELLPLQNALRDYIENQLEFAMLLSTPRQPVAFPISTETHYPRVIQLQEIIKFIDNENIVRIDIDKVVITMKKIEEYSHNLSQLNKQSLLSRDSLSSQKIEQGAIYKIFIYTFISRNLIRQVLPLIRNSLEISQKPEVITTFIMVYNLLPQLNEQCKHSLLKLSAYLYNQPLKLLAIIEHLLTKRITGLESIEYLHRQLLAIKDNYSNFNEDNPTFNVYFVHLSEERERKNKTALVQNTLIKLKKTKLQFSHEFMFDLIFIILCYEPFNLAIFLRHLKIVKWKLVRSFISYLVHEQIFDELNVLEACKRIFALLLRSYKEKIDIFRLVAQCSEKSLVQEFRVKKYEHLNDFQKVLEKNYTAFEKKKNKLMGLERSFRLKKNSFPDKEVSIKESIKNPQKYKEKSANNYVFTDSDDNYEPDDEQVVQYKESPKRRRDSKIVFDPRQQRRNFIRKDQRQNIEARKTSPHSPDKKFKDEPQELLPNQFCEELKRNNSKMKKYFSMDVRSGFGDEGNEANESIEPSPIKPLEKKQTAELLSPAKTSAKDLNSQKKMRQQKSMPSFEQQIKKKQKKQSKMLDQLAKHLLSDDQLPDEPSLFDEKRLSQKSSDPKEARQMELQQNSNALLKKIYRTFDDKQESQPYTIKAMYTEKAKNKDDYVQLFKKVVRKIYNKPERNMEIAFKLISQIAKAFGQLEINLLNVDIFEKVAKFETKYGLELPVEKILPFNGLFMKNTTPEELFNQIKGCIVEICDEENIFKISKLISISFKKNSIEQEIVFMFLGKLIEDLNNTLDENELAQGMEKIQGLISKLPVKILVERTEGIVDKCTHFDLRRKIVEIFIGTIRQKGNGKDAQQLAIKLK